MPPPCIIIFLLVLGHIWHLQDVGKTETFLRVFYGFLPPLFWTFYVDKIINVMFFTVNVTVPHGNEIYPPPCIIIFLLVLGHIWHLQDVGKTETFLRVFYGFLPPLFWTFYVDKIINAMFFTVNVTIPSGNEIYPPPCIIIFLLVLGHIWHLQDVGKTETFLRVFYGFLPPPFSACSSGNEIYPPPCIIIFLLVLGHIWHLQDVGKTETFLRVFYGFLPPLF